MKGEWRVVVDVRQHDVRVSHLKWEQTQEWDATDFFKFRWRLTLTFDRRMLQLEGAATHVIDYAFGNVTKEEKQREGSATVDKYWIDPKGGKKCRSIIEVARRAYPEYVSEGTAATRTAKKSLEDLIGERLIAPGPIVFSWPMTGEVRVRAEGILNASGKIWYEGNEYVPTGFARRAFQACNVDPSATGTTFINGYDYLTMKGSGVRIKDLR